MFKSCFKKLIILTSVISLPFVTNSGSLYASENNFVGEKNTNVIFDESVPEGALEQQAAVDAYDVLMSSPGFNDSILNPSYPDDFGGYFIGEDDRLHVQYVGDNQEKYAALFPSLEAVVLEQVDYSYNELQELADFAFSESESAIESYVDTVANQAAVGVKFDADIKTITGQDILGNYAASHKKTQISEEIGRLSDSELSVLADGANSPLNVFYANPSVTQSELWGGDEISGNGYTFTLGSTGFYQGSSAIVTCGHDLSVGSTLYYGGTRIGEVSFQRFQNDAYGDYSIITLSNTSHINSNKAFGPSGSTSFPIRVTGSVPKAGNGQSIYNYGKTTKWKSGRVISTNMTLTVSGVVLHGMTKVKYNAPSALGDSGSPVYIYKNGYKLCGIFGGGDGTYCHHTPFELISDKVYSVRTY